MRDTNVILDEMHHMFPDAKCALHHRNAYELIIAVVLSAQTTDEAVNKVTPALFERFPTPYDLAKAEESEIASYIKTIGLYRNKSKSIKNLAKSLVENFNGEVPSSMKDLTSLAGVGRKTANVVQSVWFGIPAFAVDTHVERISKRLGLAKFDDSVENVEKKLKRKIDRNRWNDGHHLFIFFGRYHCTARNPKCDNCPFTDICRNDKFQQYKEKRNSFLQGVHTKIEVDNMQKRKKLVKEIKPTQAENRIGPNNNIHDCNPKEMSKAGRNKQ